MTQDEIQTEINSLKNIFALRELIEQLEPEE